jgi:hypothetical protein
MYVYCLTLIKHVGAEAVTTGRMLSTELIVHQQWYRLGPGCSACS